MEKPSYKQLEQKIIFLEEKLKMLQNMEKISGSEEIENIKSISFKNAIDSSTEAIGISAPDGKHIYQNKSFEKLFGKIGQDPISSVYVDKELGKKVFNTIKSGKNWVGEVQMTSKDDRIIAVQLNAYPVIDHGQIVALVGVHTDTTERNKLLDALQKSEANYRLLANNTLDCIWKLNMEPRFLYINQAIERLLGYTPKEFIGTKLEQHADKENFELMHGIIMQLIEKGPDPDGIIFQAEMIHKKKHLVPLEIKAKMLFNEKGEPYAMYGVTTDITERRKAEQELLAANEELTATTDALKQSNEELQIALKRAKKSKELEETLQKLKAAQSQLIQSEKMASVGILTAGITHELNNPLNFISSGVEALYEYIEDEIPDHKEPLNLIFKNINSGITRVSDIIKSLNHFNRRTEKNNETCLIELILDNCLVMLQNQIKHHIQVEKNYCTTSLMMMGNEGKLHQLFLNILSNAVQAIEDKGKIIIKTQKKNNNLCISIIDNGCGIPEENLEKIVDPFFTTKDPGKGTGLGLAISYNIVKEHKGTINFESQINKGTTVIVSFPAL